MKAYSMSDRDQKGFTLVEVIITILVASILGLIFIQFMGTSMTGSVEPVIRVQDAFTIEQVMEKMTADYKKLMVESSTPLATLQLRVSNGNYGSYTVKYNNYITFDGSGVQVSESGDRILKVTIADVNGEQRLTSLFTK
ncbi:MAG: prepilin-type N-terminal cleavage/methylation domain-containing protein [Syntrophobacterales bacterium]|nr:prepilin-type N-terminal cleavage/methylation domain-containing protein [Syntrophobacterales bacterium]